MKIGHRLCFCLTTLERYKRGAQGLLRRFSLWNTKERKRLWFSTAYTVRRFYYCLKAAVLLLLAQQVIPTIRRIRDLRHYFYSLYN